MDKNEVDLKDLESKKMDSIKPVASISDEKAMKTEIMELTHKYNEIKDAAQTVIGALANIKGVTIKSLHKEFGLPSD